MEYDPFRRGPFPVGVRSVTLVDATRARELPTEVWYPAEDAHVGQDLADDTRDSYELAPGLPGGWQHARRDAAPRPGRDPLIVFSHGYSGHRRQSTFLCTHLASHGYVVASVDHVGNTSVDLMRQLMARGNGGAPAGAPSLDQLVAARPADVATCITQLVAGAAGDDVAARIDPDRIGVAGHSFGGWTAIAVIHRDPRVGAAFALAPAGGVSSVSDGRMLTGIAFDAPPAAPVLFVVADQDSITPLPGMLDLFARVRSRKCMITLIDADHFHFCDAVERVHEMFRVLPRPPGVPQAKEIGPIAALIPGARANEVIRGLGLAHFDAHLRAHPVAADALANDIRAWIARRGVDVDVASETI